MGTKRLTISDEAYDRLRAHRRDGENLSDVILRLTDDDRDVMKGFGSWSDSDLEDAVENWKRELE